MNNSNQITKSKRNKSKSSCSGGGHGSKKKQGIKVVYISNPMKVRASASEFRALVQQLTGQDSEFPWPADPTRVHQGYSSSSSSPDNNFITGVLSNSTAQIEGVHHQHHHHGALDLEVASSSTVPTDQEQPESSNSNISGQYHDHDQLYDDLFAPHDHEIIDNFGAFLPSTVFYGSS